VLLSFLSEFTSKSSLSLLSILVQLELTKRTADSDKYREIVMICITKVEQCVGSLEKRFNFKTDSTSAQILNNLSNKVTTLIMKMQALFTDESHEKDMQCIVFVKRRTTAKILYHIIKMLSHTDMNLPIRPDFVVGYNNEMPESVEAILSKSLNADALERFNSNETNCIICTNVLEEGIDIQACNLVIMYDPPDTPRSYFQSSGRARDENSKYIILLERGDHDKFDKNLRNFVNVNIEMKQELIGKSLDRVPPSEKLIKGQQQQSWEPFVTSTGSQLNALNSIR
jgi:endoribonuclease Dicer